MTLKEKKRRLSEILGINLFEARYKEVDGVLDTEEDSEKPSEDVNPLGGERDEASPDSAETENDSEPPYEGAETTDEETGEGGTVEEETAEEESEGAAKDTAEETEEEGTAEAPTEEVLESHESMESELFDAKLEARLLRAGIREDKIDAAKKLFRADHSLADIDEVEKWVKEYPEWVKQKTREQAKGFGIGVGEHDGGETSEEKRLRELGII